MKLENVLNDLPSLQDAANWHAVVRQVVEILESEDPEAVKELQELRDKLRPESAYALDRAIRQANSVVPMSIEGTDIWLELILLPVYWRDVRGPNDSRFSVPAVKGLSALERGLESALGVPFASVRMLQWAVDPKQLEDLPPYQFRLAMQQVGTFGDTTYLSPAEVVVDAEASEQWWLWPVTVQHTQEPSSLLGGIDGLVQHHWQRVAHLLEDNLMASVLSSPVSGHVTIRPPVSWAESQEQLQRYKVLGWLSGLQSTKDNPWTVAWGFSGSMLEMTATRPNSRPVREEFLFRPGQAGMVYDMLAKIATRFPGQLTPVQERAASPTPNPR